MNTGFPYIIQNDNLVLVIGTNTHTINKTHINYSKIMEAIKASNWDTVKDLIEPRKVILNYGKGNVSIQGATLYWKGKEMHNALAKRLIEMYQEGFPIEPMILFMENLMLNPSATAVDELYLFLEKCSLPITNDGHFLAYKRVRADFKDKFSGKFDNSVGQIVEMERNEVDDNRRRECSNGLHFCSRSYLDWFGSKNEPVMILKINPRDVVSIPADHNDAKGRCCRYEVIGQLGVAADDAFTAVVQDNANEPLSQADGAAV